MVVSSTQAIVAFLLILLHSQEHAANAFVSQKASRSPQRHTRHHKQKASSPIEKEVVTFVEEHDQTTVRPLETNLALEIIQHNHVGKQNNASLLEVVLVAGFESFNRQLYYAAAQDMGVRLHVFADSEIRLSQSASLTASGNPWIINPTFQDAMQSCDAFVGSLIFDYDDVIAVESLLVHIQGPRFLFECATELMQYNSVGSFSMMPSNTYDKSASGPPPAVKAILSKFGSGKEEDKLSGYLQLLKVGTISLLHSHYIFILQLNSNNLHLSYRARPIKICTRETSK